ncbi:MAG: ATP phosphoribosyltransferase regulatory subunit, partial [Ignavibacteria bacterium]|nr:ATP phosphoribosyltransferase regulatory subunit [Ignavibacteria bacterium]
ALLGGGRYDLLVEQLGGKPTPAVGFAAGIERILLACENEKSFSLPEPAIDIYLIRIDKELEFVVSELASKLRRENLTVDFDYLIRSVKAQMREANKMNARFAMFLGGEEYEQGSINLKNMKTGEQKIISLNSPEEIINRVKA